MRTDCLQVGWYSAHGSGRLDCLITLLRYDERERRIWVEYVYKGERVEKYYDCSTEWTMSEHTYVINELVLG